MQLDSTGPPLLVVVLALDGLGWIGFRLNMFLNDDAAHNCDHNIEPRGGDLAQANIQLERLE